MFQRITKEKIRQTTHGGFKSFLERAVAVGVVIASSKEEPALLRLKWKGQTAYCKMNMVPVLKMLGNFTVNKNLTKKILNDSGIKTPKGVKVRLYTEAKKEIKRNKMRFPLIAKPLDGSVATGVTWDIRNTKGLEKAVKLIKNIQKKHKYSEFFLVEEMRIGSEYRVLIYKNKVISCVEKIPAGVIGNGKSNVSELISIFNKKRKKGFEIKKDKLFWKTLKGKKISFDFVPAKGQIIKFRNNLNMSDGGRSIDRTAEMHKYFRKTCEEAVKLAGLTYGGVDLITPAISKKSDNYAILEINPNPYYNMHEKPLVEGKGIDFSKRLLRDIFGR